MNRFFILPLVAVFALTLGSCAGSSGQRAGEGAATGALAGAVGGVVSGLLWGGDPIGSAARGAAVGAASGAVVGGVSGAKEDKDQAETEEERETTELRTQIGEDAYAGSVALAECKHGVAEANAQVAAESTNSNYALAGLWLDALSHADRGDMPGAQDLYPEIIRWDRAIENTDQADAELQQALIKLQGIRKRYNLPTTCGV